MVHICGPRDRVSVSAQSSCHTTLAILNLAKLRISRLKTLLSGICERSVNTPRDSASGYCEIGYRDPIWRASAPGNADGITLDAANARL